MKALLLATALVMGGTAYAQSSTSPTPNSPPQSTEPMTQPGADAGTMSDSTTAAPMQDSTMSSPSTAPMQDSTMSNPSTTPMQDSSMPSSGGAMSNSGSTMSSASGGATPSGGYMPTTPALSGTPAAGSTVRVVPSASPSEAFPPPPPKDSYPVCKRGQTDGCRNPGGK